MSGTSRAPAPRSSAPAIDTRPIAPAPSAAEPSTPAPRLTNVRLSIIGLPAYRVHSPLLRPACTAYDTAANPSSKIVDQGYNVRADRRLASDRRSRGRADR